MDKARRLSNTYIGRLYCIHFGFLIRSGHYLLPANIQPFGIIGAAYSLEAIEEPSASYINLGLLLDAIRSLLFESVGSIPVRWIRDVTPELLELIARIVRVAIIENGYVNSASMADNLAMCMNLHQHIRAEFIRRMNDVSPASHTHANVRTLFDVFTQTSTDPVVARASIPLRGYVDAIGKGDKPHATLRLHQMLQPLCSPEWLKISTASTWVALMNLIAYMARSVILYDSVPKDVNLSADLDAFHAIFNAYFDSIFNV